MRGPIFVAAWATTVWVVACGGSTISATGSSPSHGPSDAGGANDAPGSFDVSARDGSAPEAPARDGSTLDGSMAPCNDVPEPTGGAQVELVGGVAPAPSGGAIRDGRYELVSALVYVTGTDGGTSLEGRSHAISVSGPTWASVSWFDNAPTTRYDDQATLSGNAVSLKRVCGSPGSGILFGAEGMYTATPSALVLNFPAGSAFGDGTAVLTFARAPDADAAAPIGAPCSNSYGCYLSDAGGPPAGIACGADGRCEACTTNGLNDPCLGRPPNSPQGPDCCPGLRCVNSRCVL
jgi:hypothetical protein